MKHTYLFSLFLLASPLSHAAVEFNGGGQAASQQSGFEFPNQPVQVQYDTAGEYTNNYDFSVTPAQKPTQGIELSNIKTSEDLLSLAVTSPAEATHAAAETKGSGDVVAFTDLQPDTFLLQFDSLMMDGGNHSLSPVSPLLDPSTLALMMAGFGLVGFMSNRRRQMV